MKERFSKLRTKSQLAVLKMQEKAVGLMHKKTVGASHLIEILGVCIVVLALIVIFRTQIINFITSIGARLQTEALSLF